MDQRGDLVFDANKKNMVSILAHKLKEPLTSINLYTESLLSGSQGKLSRGQDDYLREIQRSAAKMLKNINEILGNLDINNG